MAHIRQSRPVPGIDVHVKDRKTLERVPSSRGSGNDDPRPQPSHGGLRHIHQKLPCLDSINFEAICGETLAT